jgi:glycosyltransferase involved in cell wall biosynthesis
MEFAARRLGVPRRKLVLLLQPVDQRFWTPGGSARTPTICAVGSEARDLPTLIEAVSGLPITLELAIGSMVFTPTESASGRLPTTLRGVGGKPLPSNVVVHQGLSPLELRELYRRSRFAVVALRDVEFDAGATAITEAFAMGKAVIVSQTRGQVDLVRHGREGLMVRPSDPRALREAIVRLMEDEDSATEMGRWGRAIAETRHGLDAYADRFAEIVLDGPRGPGRPVGLN